MESQNAEDTIKELERVKKNALVAFQYAKGQYVSIETLKNAVLAKQLFVLSEILTTSFDGAKITPFSLLDEQKKKTISFLIEEEISSLRKFHNYYSGSVFTLNKAMKAKAIMNGLLGKILPVHIGR